MRIAVVGDSETITGFQLAGVDKVYRITQPKDALIKIEELIKNEDIGLIIITEKIGDALREEIKALTEGRVTPLVVEIPDKKGPLKEKVDPIKELIKRAVGVEIRYE